MFQDLRPLQEVMFFYFIILCRPTTEVFNKGFCCRLIRFSNEGEAVVLHSRVQYITQLEAVQVINVMDSYQSERFASERSHAPSFQE